MPRPSWRRRWFCVLVSNFALTAGSTVGLEEAEAEIAALIQVIHIDRFFEAHLEDERFLLEDLALIRVQEGYLRLVREYRRGLLPGVSSENEKKQACQARCHCAEALYDSQTLVHCTRNVSQARVTA